MPVKILGTKKVSPRDTAYPGTSSHMMFRPVSTRTMASPTDTHTPMDRALPMARWEMEPLDTSSTCLVSTATAGSALTM